MDFGSCLNLSTMAPISVSQVAVLERFNCSRIWYNTSDIISYVHEYTIWLPINITGDKLLLQTFIFLFYFIENSETSSVPNVHNFLGLWTKILEETN